MLNTIEPRISLPNPRIKNKGRPFCTHDIPLTEPNAWFANRFPQQTLAYGSAFLLAKSNTLAEDVWIPLYLNDDLFASILGGAAHYGHQVVYFPPEDAFYFYDYLHGAFCLVSEHKLKVLVSNFLVRCAQDSVSYVHVQNLVVAFRKDDALNRIITKAKAILEVDRTFFEGANGKRRFIDGNYIEAYAEPSYQLFVKQSVVRNPDAKLTVRDAFHRYSQFCKNNAMQPLTRSEFRDLVAEVIRQEFDLGIRHDIVGENGKATHGWDGVACLLPPVMSLN